MAERGRLTARVVACLWWERERGGEQIDEMLELRRTGSVGRLRATTVKIMHDGVAENQTAAMLQPYLDGHGHPGWDRSQLRRPGSAQAPRDQAGRGGVPGPFPCPRRSLGARGARRARRREGGEWQDRRTPPPGSPPGRRSGRLRTLRGPGRDGQHPAVLGLLRPPDGRSDPALPCQSSGPSSSTRFARFNGRARVWPEEAIGRSARPTSWRKWKWRSLACPMRIEPRRRSSRRRR